MIAPGGRRVPWFSHAGPAAPPRMGRWARTRRAIAATMAYTAGEPTLSMILALATCIEGVAAFGVLLVVLQHRSSSASAARQGITRHEWLYVSLVAVGILLIGILLAGALSIRLITFLRGEPVGAARSWLLALRSIFRLGWLYLGRWTIALTTRPLRRNRAAGGLSWLFGRRRGQRVRLRGGLSLALATAEGLSGRQRRARSYDLLVRAPGSASVIDPPTATALVIAALLLGGSTAVAWNASRFLGLVVGLVGLLLAVNSLVLLSTIVSTALYIYLTNDAATLGFQTDDLKAIISPPPRRRSRRRR
ncbi:MAG: hypothetical protein WCL38_00890 [Actinomycetota bacterium]